MVGYTGENTWAGKERPDLLRESDAVGFAVDNCLVKYDFSKLARPTVNAYLKELHLAHGYPEEITHLKESANGFKSFTGPVVWDIPRGTLLSLGAGKRINQAVSGFQQLSRE